uniref:Kinesin family member 6 n=1 Tax=Rousettus aegyptiacus TaxID=9407 RepID=A0A7J8KA48_ROUAE|nr:kinesin family member 6 [Rousettus aegyptiacus]
MTPKVIQRSSWLSFHSKRGDHCLDFNRSHSLCPKPSDANARKILPSPCPVTYSQEQNSTSDSLDNSIPKRPASSIPLTGDSQTDSDILAFIKARQNILQKKCFQ